MASVLVASPPTAAQSEGGVAAAAIPQPGRFLSAAKWDCLTPTNNGFGRDVIVNYCLNRTADNWNVVPLDDGTIGMVNKASYQCLEGLGAQGGWNAVQSDCGWGDSQRWYPIHVNPAAGEWAFLNKVTGKCLDVADWGRSWDVYTYECHYGANQRWRDIGY